MKFAVFIAALIAAPAAWSQSSEVSQASALSLEASGEAAALTVLALHEGSQLAVTALRPVGKVVQVSVTASATGASVVIQVAAETVEVAGLAVGTAVVASAVGAGFLLSVGAQAIAFVPNEIARQHIRHRQL